MEYKAIREETNEEGSKRLQISYLDRNDIIYTATYIKHTNQVVIQDVQGLFVVDVDLDLMQFLLDKLK